MELVTTKNTINLNIDKIHLTPVELAKRFRMSVGALANWRVQGKGPKFMKVGSKVLYPLSEIEMFEHAVRVNSTSQMAK